MVFELEEAPTVAPTFNIPQDCAADISVNYPTGSPAGCTVTALTMQGIYIPGQLIMVRNGKKVKRSTDADSCPTNWKIWAPTNQQDLQVAFDSSNDFVDTADPHFIMDVTRNVGGCGGCAAAMNSNTDAQTTDLTHPWKTTDGRPWFMRNSGYGEPNGDYHANCYLQIYGTQPGDLQFNDLNCEYESHSYLCQPKLGHFVGYAGHDTP